MSNLAVSSEEIQPKPSYKQVLSNANYRKLLGAQFVSDLGDGVYALSLIWAMKMLTGSAVHMSIVLAAELIPTILFGVFAGVAVDRGSKRKIMMAADLFRGLVVAVLAGLWWYSLLEPWMLVVSAVVLSSFSAFFSPARAVAIRTLVPGESMMQAQSISSTMQTIVGLSAPAIAAILLAVSVTFAFAFNAVTFFLSLVFVLWIREEKLDEKKEGKLDIGTLKSSLKEGYKTIISVPILRSLIFYAVMLNFMFAPIAVLFPLYVDEVSKLATFQTVFFVGIFVGALSVGFMSKLPKFVPIVSGILLILIAFGSLAFVDNFYVALGCILLAGFGSPLTNITLSSLFMVRVPREVLGRASSTMRIFMESSKPISLLLTGSLLVMFTVRELFLFIAVFGAVVVLLMICTPSIRKGE